MLLDQILEDYLALKGNNVWLTMKYSPTRNECAEFRKIALDNLLRKAGPCLFQACVVDTILQPIQNPPFDIRICISDVCLALQIDQQNVEILYHYHQYQLHYDFPCYI